MQIEYHAFSKRLERLAYIEDTEDDVRIYNTNYIGDYDVRNLQIYTLAELEGKLKTKHDLTLVKSESFGDIPCDIYRKDSELYMTIEQLAQALGYADRSGVQKIFDRNGYLKTSEFSTRDKLSLVEGNRTVTRDVIVFTEDGIYEVTMLSKTEKAREFRAWVRNLLKSIREGEAVVVPATTPQTPTVTKALSIDEMNTRIRYSNQMLRLAKSENLSSEYRENLTEKAADILMN